MQFLRSLVGAHYSWSGSPVRVPLNLLRQASDIYLRALAPRAPRALVTTRNPQLKPVASDMQAWMDRGSRGMKLGDTIRICVMNALHCIGILKIAEASTDTDPDSTGITVGQPFVENVDPDDWVHDMTAKRYDQIIYSGNRWRTSLEEAKENPHFDKKQREKLVAATRFGYNERGDTRSTSLSQSTSAVFDEVEESVELWNIWLPREKLVITVPYQDSVVGSFSVDKPLQIVEWDGPRQGPYHILTFGDVPNNVMPAAPMQALIDMHELVNTLWRKLARQGERQKKLLLYSGTATDDANRINQADDGMCVRADMPERIKEVNMGGMDSENLAALTQAKQLFDEEAGNLQSLGGLGPQSPTLGQDKLIAQQASAQVQEMQDRTINFTRGVYEALGQLWWENPVLLYKASREVAGMSVAVKLPPQMRQAPWDSFDFDIDPYSMTNQSPEGKAQVLMELVQSLVLPTLSIMQQQGVSLKMPALLDILGKYKDLPELGDILEIGPPPEMQGVASAAQQPPASTTHTTIRRNVPTQTNRNAGAVLAQALHGAANRQQVNGLQ